MSRGGRGGMVMFGGGGGRAIPTMGDRLMMSELHFTRSRTGSYLAEKAYSGHFSRPVRERLRAEEQQRAESRRGENDVVRVANAMGVPAGMVEAALAMAQARGSSSPGPAPVSAPAPGPALPADLETPQLSAVALDCPAPPLEMVGNFDLPATPEYADLMCFICNARLTNVNMTCCNKKMCYPCAYRRSLEGPCAHCRSQTGFPEAFTLDPASVPPALAILLGDAERNHQRRGRVEVRRAGEETPSPPGSPEPPSGDEAETLHAEDDDYDSARDDEPENDDDRDFIAPDDPHDQQSAAVSGAARIVASRIGRRRSYGAVMHGAPPGERSREQGVRPRRQRRRRSDSQS